VVAIAGQAATTRMHKESHQHLDLVRLFESISKYSTQVRAPEIVPEVVRKAFKVAEAEKPGVSFIDFPEDVAALDAGDAAPLKVQAAVPPDPRVEKIEQAARVISEARYPIVMAGNGVIRARASEALVRFAERLNVPVATTFMAKGVIPFSHPLSLGAIGLQAHDYVSCGFDRADVIICVGYDMVEYHPYLWHPNRDKKIVHIDASPAEVDEHYILEVGVVGNIGSALDAIAQTVEPKDGLPASGLRQAIEEDFEEHAHDTGFPIKPQKILWDLRQALEPDDIVISDVGAHKMWTARMYQAERPNTCIISNGFASMGIALPGAIGARIARPGQAVVALTGDAGFLMNSQELETAIRVGTPIVVLIWSDSEYGLIKWKQMQHFGRESHIDFSNPDFVRYAASFGAAGFRVESAEELPHVLREALDHEGVSVIDCPVDYSENLKLTERLGQLICPI
jgi:acetolactate synthase-1/2/3 large subunit